MKRLFALVLTLCFVCTMGVTALAAQADVLSITAKDCAPGATIELVFGLKTGSNVAAANFEVTYDTDTFEYVAYEDGELIDNCLAVGNGVDGKFLYALATTTSLTDEGDLFTLEFKVDSKASGKHTFYFYTTSCADVNGNDIDVKTASTQIQVKGEAVSDVSVTPVTSETEDGSEVTVSADNGESATGVRVDDKTDKDETTDSSDIVGNEADGTDDGGKKDSTVWVVIGIIGAVVVVTVVVLLLVTRRKKNDGEEEVPHQSILDDDAKALLDMTPDSLEDESQDK